MKKIIIFLFEVLCVFSLCACNTNSVNNQINKNVLETTQLIMNESYATIILENSQYSYTIYDGNGNIIEQGQSIHKPKISMLNANVLKFSLQEGTGNSTQWGFYYDYDNKIRSPRYKCIYDEKDNWVLYGEKDRLVIKDIFSDNVCQEFKYTDFTPDISDIVEPIVTAKFVDESLNVEVTYFSGDDFHNENQTLVRQGMRR